MKARAFRLGLLGLVLALASACATPIGDPSPPADGGEIAAEDGGSAEDGGALDGGNAQDGGAPDGGDAGPPDAGRDDRTWPAPVFNLSAPSDLQEPGLGVNAYFSPTDDVRAVVLRELDAVHRKLHVAMFSVGDARVAAKLLALRAAGIEVRLLWDKTQAESTGGDDLYGPLVDGGIDITKVAVDGGAFASLHDKFAILDDARVVTGSNNWSVSGFTQNDEHLLTIAGGLAPGRYEAAWQSILAGRSGSVSYDPDAGVNVQMGPADHLDQAVVRRIRAAQRSIYVAMFDLSQASLIDELVAARQRGVRVVMVIDLGQAAGTQLDEALECGGRVVDGGRVCPDGGARSVVLRADTRSGYVKMHEKFSVYDETYVIAGSYNWTSLATYYNHENLVELRSPRLAARFLGHFLELLRRYDSTYTNETAPPAAYGFTPGDVRVIFEVKEPRLRDGDAILIAPEPQTTGTGGARAMTRRSDGFWEAALTVPAGRRVQYKFLVRDRFGELHWEGGPLHYYVPIFGVPEQRWSDDFRLPPEGN